MFNQSRFTLLRFSLQQAKKTSDKYSDIYFKSRPFSSQVGAIVSNQSQIISSYDDLLIKYDEFLKENIPKFLCSNEDFTEVFNYRWWMITKRLKEWEEKEARKLLDILIKKKVVKAYAILVEASGKTVAQAEHTFIPTQTGVTVTTTG